jgi:hypothetical protein
MNRGKDQGKSLSRQRTHNKDKDKESSHRESSHREHSHRDKEPSHPTSHREREPSVYSSYFD